MASRNNIRLASFDGGGVRGFSQLKIMDSIMHQLKHDRYPNDPDKVMLPCEHFDLIGGSGTGGLIAIMFAKLRMTVKEVSDEFFTIFKEVYEQDELSSVEKTQNLRQCMETLMKRKGFPVNLEFEGKIQAACCASFVLATYCASATGKVVLRSYPTRSQLPSTVTVIDAVLAACAVPPDFAPVTSGSGHNKREYIAAGLGEQNPIRDVITEALALFGGGSSVALLLSLGTGNPGVTAIPPNHEVDLHRLTRAIANDCEQKAQDIERQIGSVGIYFRFSADQSFQNHYARQAANPGLIATRAEVYLSDKGTSVKIDALVQNFDGAAQRITLDQLEYVGGATVSSQSTVTLEMVMEAIESIKHDPLLTKLKPPDLEYGPQVSECMEGTRRDILARIEQWTTDFSAPNILWVKGYPGVGKSAIATSMVEHLSSLRRLGSSFFFQRQKAASMTPNTLWRAIAYDLALQYHAIGRSIVAALNADDTISTTVNVDKLFRELIQQPLTGNVEIPAGRLPIIVIDALDECGGLEGQYSVHRKHLLRTLEGWPRLPRHFKLIVTSRVESDIEQLFSTVDHRALEIMAGQKVEAQSSEDVERFLAYQLRQIAIRHPRSLSPDWPQPDVVQQLANKAAGLFIWATTVTRFIELGQPKRRLSQILQGASTGDMAALYEQILNISFPDLEEEEIGELCTVVGTIILAKAPLSFLSLALLLSIDDSAVENMCNGLLSVLESSGALQFRHQSFVDFILDPARSNSKFFVKREQETRALTMACLRVMKDGLRFNICDFKSSYLRNTDVPDLESRVEECIHPHLFYSSCFWASHLAEARFDIAVFECLLYFMENQFLFWLEILSLTKRVNIASSMLVLLTDWIQTSHHDNAMPSDMRKFVAAFAGVISQSVPHIYLSALPFSPQTSAVSKQYRGKFPRTITMQTGGLSSWPVIQNILLGHSEIVDSVAFSPDGQRVVSGSQDKTIRVWDAETGEVTAGPFRGHDDFITSVAFSPEGRRIVSGSEDETVRVWDANTGEIVAGPFEGHFNAVSSVAFSPDGKRIVSGSDDERVRVWDAATGGMVAGPFRKHTDFVRSVAFSPDGKKIVSGSVDQTVCVWDAETGEMTARAFKGHSHFVTSVAFSPDGSRVVSGSWDKTVRIWNSKTGDATMLLEGHSGMVQSVAFSQDGRRIVSCSNDKTIRVWDADTGEVVAGPFEGHASSVRSVAFSQDGKRIASGSQDMTVRIWDAATREVIAGPLEGHDDAVVSIAFSPDGKQVVSGSADKTVRVWDTETGKVVAGPFTGHGHRIHSVAFSPDGKRVFFGSDDATMRIVETKTGEAVVEPFTRRSAASEQSGAPQIFAISSDAKLVARDNWDDTLFVWNTETGEVVAGPFAALTQKASNVTFSPDSKWILTNPGHETIEVRDIKTGEVVIGPLEHKGGISSVAFSPDGKRIVSGSLNKTIRVWDAETGVYIAGPLEGHRGAVCSVSFSQDGRRIVSGSQDRTVRVWEAETGEVVVGPLEGHNGAVQSVTFSPDGKKIVSGSSDNTIRLWDGLMGETTHRGPVAPFFSHGSTMRDGWALGRDAEPLFWVPPTLREGILQPNNRWATGKLMVTRLDLQHFVHGEAWSRCKDHPA